MGNIIFKVERELQGIRNLYFSIFHVKQKQFWVFFFFAGILKITKRLELCPV